MGRAVGIDLGTTNSCVAVFDGDGDPKVLPAPDGSRTTPSVVAFAESGERLVGQAARRQAITNPTHTLSSVKRLMGARPDEITAEDRAAFPTLHDTEAGVRFDARGTNMSPEEISAMILGRLRSDAEEFLGEDITDAVITVPAYFNDAQRQATKDAGKIAGLNVLRIINEPTAAALAYGLDRTDEEQTILVFDLGGGTFDVSILEIGDGVFDVRATAGDNQLGGDDFDRAIVAWLVEQIKDQSGVDLGDDAQTRQRLFEAAEKAKQELSGLPSVDIHLPFLTQDASGSPVHYSGALTRATLEHLCAPLLGRLAEPIRSVMADADIAADDIGHLLLVGGMTRMPAVQNMVRSLTGLEPTKSVNPDEVVALGAAVQAKVLTGGDDQVLLLDVTPLSLGIETRGGLFNRLIERNTTIPCRKVQVFTTAEDDQSSVELHILQGEREMSADNRTLGRLQLLGILPAPRGVPQVEVSFELDADGILAVHAIDLGTGNVQQARLDNGTGLDEDTLARMISEAQHNARSDAKVRRLAELRNRADGLIYTAQETATQAGERLDASSLARLLDATAALRSALHGGADEDALEAACEELTQASYEAVDALYRQGAPTLNIGPLPTIDVDARDDDGGLYDDELYDDGDRGDDPGDADGAPVDHPEDD